MTEEVPVPTRPLTAEERSMVDALNAADLEAIDAAILAACRDRWRKVAMVVATTMHAIEGRFSELPDGFYAERVARLVENGQLEQQGDLAYMRFSEVRLSARS